MEKKILTVISKIEELLIFLAPKFFLIQTYCEEILSFVKVNLSNIQAQVKGDSCVDNYDLTNFLSLLNIYKDQRIL